MMGETVKVGTSDVTNVIVEVGLSKDIKADEVPAGARVDYTLRFPVSADAPGPDDKVTVRGNVLDVLNVPDHWNPANVFGSWSNPFDMTVLVGKTLGDLTASIVVVNMTTTIDELGDPIYSESTVFSGNAQARMQTGAESDSETFESLPVETWFFVVPWQVGFGSLRPQGTFIDYNGARYDVKSIENVDNKSEFASFKALRCIEKETGETGETGITGA